MLCELVQADLSYCMAAIVTDGRENNGRPAGLLVAGPLLTQLKMAAPLFVSLSSELED